MFTAIKNWLKGTTAEQRRKAEILAGRMRATKFYLACLEGGLTEDQASLETWERFMYPELSKEEYAQLVAS